MKSLLYFCMATLVFSVGCSSKKGAKSQEQVIPEKVFYSDLQIVTETVAGEGCSAEKKVELRKEVRPRISVTDENQLQLHQKDWLPKYYVLNVSLQSMGFDVARVSWTSLDGFVPSFVPYEFKISRVRGGGGVIRLQYLDQDIRLDLKSTPIYSFAAKEDRDGCELVHNVNVFAENTGNYKFPK